jgi:hypothetical protein
MTHCVACGSPQTLELISIDHIPVLCNDLHATAEAARQAPTGRMDLTFCRHCGHYFNRSFDASRMYYSANYETSLYASAVFRTYAESLVNKLIADHGIRDKTILEIGSGRGEFLRRLCAAGANRGIGFDTSTPVEGSDPEGPNVRYVRDYFSAAYNDVRADLIVCQQVLEHVENPKEFLAALASTTTFQAGSPIIYFEVPNGLYTAKHLGIWDLIYEHISYFTPTSLRRLFEDTGFNILEMGAAFGDQYLYVTAQAKARDRHASTTVASRPELETAAAFSKSFADKISYFRSWMAERDTELARTFVWGAGSKGITFCNLIDPDGRFAGLLDKNTAKHGKHIARTGLRIAPLEGIDARGITNVVIMNPQYTEEIRRDLARAGASATLVSA